MFHQNHNCDSEQIYSDFKCTVDSYLQKLSISSSTEGSTVDIAPLEEEAEALVEDPTEPKACFTEGMVVDLLVVMAWKD